VLLTLRKVFFCFFQEKKMDLKLKDVAELLNVTEDKIKCWVADGIIPSYRIGDSWRFSRIEIEDWVLRNKSKDTTYTTQEEDVKKAKGSRQFSLYRALHNGGVLHSVPGVSKEEVIRNAMKIIAYDLELDVDILIDLLLDREQLQPTAIGGGIGLPHTRESFLKKAYDYVYVAFPEKPIDDYGALDGQPVHTLFFLFAKDDKNHLHLLAKIAYLSSQLYFQKLIQTSPTKNRLLEEIKNIESRVDGK
jgi:PTS system nitrogen regulatory IIA component